MSVSRDQKWIVCGADEGVNMWDGEMRWQKVIDVEHDNDVWAVDVSPDSTRLATGTANGNASIWSITSGERLVGPLEHDDYINGLQFSPTGKHIATASLGGNSIRIFDSHTGDKLITINTDIPNWFAAAPLAWSSDAQKIFAASHGNKIKAFDVSTGSQLAESQILHDGNNNVPSIALAPNGKFITSFAKQSITLLDTTTLTRIDLPVVIEESEDIRSISISLDNSHLAIGRFDGKIVIRDLSKILPDSYGPFHIRSRDEIQQDQRSFDIR
ncbi:hypothetical protein J3R82DRAFT_98 [Butyriboletus roseoflavus]|nr:hypothetical protein J3R82DRAFT_98 [Butyriboletus roseoflavus]